MERYVDTEALADAAEIRLEWPGYVELVFSLVLVWGFGDALSTLFAARFAGAQAELNRGSACCWNTNHSSSSR